MPPFFPDSQLLTDHAAAWLLVAGRMAGMFAGAPVFSSLALPVRYRAVLAIGLSWCLYPMLLGRASEGGGMVLGLSAGWGGWLLGLAVGAEVLVGLAMGLAAGLPIAGVRIGAQVIDQQLGLALGGVYDPEHGEQAGPTSQLFLVIAVTLFVLLGGHRVLVEVLAGSFEQVPPRGWGTDFAGLTGMLVGLLGVMMQLAVQVCAPVVGLMLVVSVAMGFLMRTMPQMNILSVGLPLRAGLGLGMLLAAVGVLMQVYADALAAALGQLTRMMTGGGYG